MAINYPVIFKTDTSQLDKAGSSLKKFGGIAAGVGAAASAAIVGIGVTAVKEFAKFDSALNKSISIMGDVSDTLQDDMAEAAKEVAKTTSFSAEQAAESYFFLASAGLDAAASVEAMPQVAKFAQAGMFDMALATDLATDAQSALGLASDDAGQNLDNLTRVTDVFVKANTLANTSVEQLATAMTSKAGNAIKTVGKDIEEGSAALAVFADQGIKGERAGTLLTNTLFGLTDAVEKNPAVLRDMNVEIFDSEGNMRNLADIAEQLSTSLDGMSTEAQIAQLSQLGLTKQAREGVLALVGQEDSLRDYEAALRDAGGTAEEVANKQLMTLEGQLGLLSDKFNVAAIELGEAFEPATAGMVASFNDLADVLLPEITGLFEKAFLPGFQFIAEKVGEVTEELLAGESMGDIIGRQIADIGQTIADKFGEIDFAGIISNFADFSHQLRMSILDSLPGVIEGLVEFIPQFVAFITEQLIPTMLDNAQLIFVNLISTIQEVLPMLAEGISTLIPQLIQSLAELLPEIVGTIIGFIPALLDTGLQLFNSIVDALVEMIPQITDTLVDLLPKLIETLMDMLPDIIQASLDLFMGIVDALVETIPVILNAIIEAFPQITGQLIEMLPDLIEAALELFFGIVTGLVDSIPKILNAIIEMIPQITAQMIDMLPDIVEAAVDLFFGIIEGLVEATPAILEAVIELIPKVTGALIGEMPKLLEAGFNILKGIAQGIFNNVTRIAQDIASRIGGAVMSAINGFFGIRSPSRLMMGVGEDLLAGLSKGIADSEDLAVGATLEMASNVRIASENAIVPNRPPSLGVFESGASAGGAGNTFNITVNTGVGADPVAVGREVVDAIKRYESVSGRVFAAA